MSNVSLTDLYSEEIENNLIGILLVDKDSNIKILNQVKTTDLYQRSLSYIYNGILELHKSSKPVDIVSVSEYLKFKKELELAGGRSKINELALNAELNINIDYQIKTLIKYSKKRNLLSICNQATRDLNNGVDSDEVAVTLSNTAQDILNRSTSTNYQSLASGIIETLDNVGRLIENDNNILGVDTGFNNLNRLLNGLCQGRLYILAARPSVGKSAFAQQISESVAEKKNVLFFSLEMSNDEYAQRSIYRRSGYNQTHLTNKIYSPDVILDAFAKAGAELEPLKLNIVDDSKCTLNIIERNIQQLKAKMGSCDLVVIDYLQLMKSDNKFRREDYDVVTENSKGLKQLARKYKVPILALAQLSRACEQRADKRPMLSDLRDSGSLEQDADVVMFLYRDEIYNPMSKGTAKLIIAKNRQGQRGRVINLSFNGSKTEFKEM